MRITITLISSVLFWGCGPTVRPYFMRSVGGYVMPDASRTPTAKAPILSAAWLSSEQGRSSSHLRKVAESYLGTPYDWGGQSRSGIDCSGFVRQVFSETFGIKLPHNSSAMFNLGKEVEKDELQPGDIVFFKSWGYIDHSGIYMGNNCFIHSTSSVGVAYSTLDAPYFSSHFAGARRMMGTLN